MNTPGELTTWGLQQCHPAVLEYHTGAVCARRLQTENPG